MRNNGRLSEMPMAVWVQKLPPLAGEAIVKETKKSG
jgi:hypothetical protein